MNESKELAFTRVYDAPPALLFRLWTEPRHFANWYGPRSFTFPVCEIDPRPGGRFLIVFRAPDGTEFTNTGTYPEFDPPAKLVLLGKVTGAGGKAYLESLTTVTFEPHNGQTRLTVHTKATALVPFAAQMLAGMEPGWLDSLDRLNDLCNAQ